MEKLEKVIDRSLEKLEKIIENAITQSALAFNSKEKKWSIRDAGFACKWLKMAAPYMTVLYTKRCYLPPLVFQEENMISRRFMQF